MTEELEDEYPEEHPQAQREMVEIVRESGSRFTRKRLLMSAGAATGGALGLAALTPVLSLGPLWDTAPLDKTPWRRGVRLVDEDGRPIPASFIQHASFYTAFAEGADPENIAAAGRPPPARPQQAQAPGGRARTGRRRASSPTRRSAPTPGAPSPCIATPTFPVVEPHPALVCPCHYSTFDPFTGATVIYGPAGRPLPQLPLMIDADGYLRAAGNFSGAGRTRVVERQGEAHT